MNLHEYQAKSILAKYGVPVPMGGVAASADDSEAVARKIGASRFAVKAQVHAGGRGLAGGVQIVEGVSGARSAAEQLLGKRLVTQQTGPEGRIVRKVHVEEAIDVARVVYIAALLDGETGRLALIGARKGGEDISVRMARDPSIIEKLVVDGTDPAAMAGFASFLESLGLEGALAKRARPLLAALVKAFLDNDASLIEINPLAVTADGDLIALDVKMVIDDNALFRQPEPASMREDDDLDATELEAQQHQINYIRMSGNVGVVVNGAGLALATLDMLQDASVTPANFMDIRTTASSLDIARGFDLVLANPQVKVVLVNVHGGGMQRCDTVAEGIGIALKRGGRNIPIVVRFAGNNADYGRTLLGNYGVQFVRANDMADAIDRIAALAHQEAA